MILSRLLAALIYLASPLADASTTIEKTKWCQYTDSQGKVVFSGQCRVNWGVIGASPCSEREPTAAIARYILNFTPKSEVFIYFFCDGSVLANDKQGILTERGSKESPTYHLVTEEQEIFEWEHVEE